MPAEPDRVDGEPHGGLRRAHLRAARARRGAPGSRKSSANVFVATTSSATMPSAEQRDGVARELLLRRHLAARHEAPPRDQPAAEDDDEHQRQREHVPVAGCRPIRGSAGARPLRPGAERGKTRENEPDEEPEEEPRAQRPRRAAEPDPLPPAQREEIDARDEERHEQRDQHELDRPAADDAVAEPDVARRALRELEPAVERAERLLGGAAELRELAHRGAARRCRRTTARAGCPSSSA